MEHKINKLNVDEVKRKLHFRLNQYKYRVDLMRKALPIIERYQGKKITKHITTAINKELSLISSEEDFRGVYLHGALDYKDSIKFNLTPIKCKFSGRFLNDYNNSFTIELGDIKWPEKSGVVVEDVKNFKWNKRYTDPETIKKILDEFVESIYDCKRVVEKNNKLYEEVQKLYKETAEIHSANQYAFR